MAKAIIKDGKVFRMRRGVLVEIPPQWVGKFPTDKTIRQRPSKAIHKRRKDIKIGSWHSSRKKIADEINKKEQL